MISSALVNRYANALVDVVTSASAGVDAKSVGGELRQFEAAVASEPSLGTILASPAVPVARKRVVIRRIAEALGLSRIVTNFLLVLGDRRRAGDLASFIVAFETLLDERGGLARAEVRSAMELSEAQRQKLAAQLGTLAGGQVRMTYTVDPDLIGGVTARLGSKVYDGSVRGRLAGLRQRLAVQ